MSSHRPDLRYVRQFVDAPDTLFSWLCENVEWNRTLRARMTASFGLPYDYSNMTYPEAPMPAPLVRVCDSLERELGFRPNNCLLNHYPDGVSTMGFHFDSTEELEAGTGVAIVSVGAERTLTYRSRLDPEVLVPVLLEAGSMLYMDDRVQDEWMHGVRRQTGAGPRISLTFRRIVAAGPGA